MPKQFIYFLIVIQAILSFGHWLLWAALIFFFPSLQPYGHALLATLLLLSVSFLGFSVVTFRKENSLLRMGYILSGVWTVAWFYFMIAAAASSILSLAGSPNFAWFTFGCALLFSLYGIVNARITRITSIEVQLPNMPENWRGKTAVLVSDLHLGHVLKQGFAQKVISRINQLNPDIVLIPGDFFDGVKANFQELADLFKQIKAPHGTYFCSGNHELFAGMNQCEDAIRQAGIRILEDEVVNIDGLQIAGIAYKHERMPDLAERLQKLNIDTAKPSILLKHVPLQLEGAAKAGISLHLSGHTHTGQVWPGPLITRRYYAGYDYGFKKYGKMLVGVTSGVGTWGPAMRTFTKSEIVQITFN